jgi:hypothetical protein
MAIAQSYIVRVLRKVERWLNENNQSAEAAKVGRIVQKLAQAEDIHEVLNSLYAVERFDEVALRLMWLLDGAERNESNAENGKADYEEMVLVDLVKKALRRNGVEKTPQPHSLPTAQIDDLFISLHRFGRATEELKRRSFEAGQFQGTDESLLYKILNELAVLRETAVAAGKEDVRYFAAAGTEFVQYVLDNGLFQDVRVVNVLDNANLTLQTVFEVAGVEDDSLQSTIEILQQPKDLLD